MVLPTHHTRGFRWKNNKTSLKVQGSIPDGVMGIFHWHNLLCRTMALGSKLASWRNAYQGYISCG